MRLLLYVLIGLGLLAALVIFRMVRRVKRSFDDFSERRGKHLLHWSKEVDSTLEKWHEYDEEYQRHLQGSPQPGRSVTLGPTRDRLFPKD